MSIRGTTMTYSYDANNNLTGVNYSDGTPDVSYDYDDFDRLEEMVDGIGTWGYGYDANSRLTSVDGPWNEDTITYGYDDLGRRTSMTPQRGTALTYVHDTLNRLTEIQRGTVATTYTYAYSGVNPLVQSLTRPNGSVTSYQYDLLNRLEEIANKASTSTIINQFGFTYNNEDMRGSETITNGPAMPTLTEEDTTYSYNEVNQLLSTTNPNQTFLYDDDGNLIQGYTPEGYLFSATYDAENRLTAFEYTDGGGIDQRTEYKYSGDAPLLGGAGGGFSSLAEVWKYELTTLVERILIVRDGFLAIQDREPDNTVLREYTWGLNLGGGISGLIDLEQNGQNYAYLYDGKGNVVAVLDNSEAVVATYQYDPFGILLAQSGSLTQPFGFSTKRYDPQTGLVYYGHCYYSPAIGRWTTRDPLGEAGGLNLYEFVGNNPVNWVDPWGLRGNSTAAITCPAPLEACGGGSAGPSLESIGRDMAGAAVGLAISAIVGPWLWDAINDSAKDESKVEPIPIPKTQDDDNGCPPCRLIDGTIVPVGTIAYRYDTTHTQGPFSNTSDSFEINT